LITFDGSGLTKITSDARANFYPSWSPDGSRLAFSSNRDGDWDIYVMNADGSRVRQLVDSPGLDDKPQWSPDGSRIGFATNRSGSPELLAVDPETGGRAGSTSR
jgi:Tol biopolymer transport system component